jgi:hypothetical protein
VAELPENEKRSHASVDYEAQSTHGNDRCSRCRHFIDASPPRCEGVRSPIAAGAWCKRFLAKAHDLARKGLSELYG